MELSEFGVRLAKLRSSKGVSARDMSLDMGMSENYINKIELGKARPSMAAFFDICDYLKISQKDFFDQGNTLPEQLNGLVEDFKSLDDKSKFHLAGLVKEFVRNK